MAIVFAFSSQASRSGARGVTTINLATREEDLGYKIQVLISTVNHLVSFVSAAVTASQVSALSFAYPSVSNFRA